MSYYDDLIGQKFGRLTVISLSDNPKIRSNGKHLSQCVCKCDCGTENFIVPCIYLTRSIVKSCGCIRREKHEKLQAKLKAQHKTPEEIQQRKLERHLASLKRKEEYNNLLAQKRQQRLLHKKQKDEQKQKEKEQRRKLAHGNQYEFHDNYIIGYTHNHHKPFYIDIEDYEKVKPYTWYDRNTNGITTIATTMLLNDGKKHSVVMHVFLGYKWHDHINNNELDNRKENLRPCTHQQNTYNKKIAKDNKYGVSGITLDKNNKWHASIGHNYKNINLGTFLTKEDAITARLKAEKQYFGEFAPQKHLFKQYNIDYEKE